jgi:retron-type reverse transcriptase
MYQSLVRDTDDLFDLVKGKEPALYNKGDHRRVLNYHRRHAERVAAGNPLLPSAAPYLWRRMTDTRSLRCALDELVADGPKQPGEDSVRIEEMDDADRWGLCRRLSRDLKSGEYHPGPLLVRKVPKEGKPGEFREITLLCARDRVAAKALALFVGPLVEPYFSPYSFGFRPETGVWQALATAIEIARRTGRWFWVAADIERAFDRMPAEPALDACRRFLTDDVVEFVRVISFGDRKRGSPQGSPWSPLLFNIFADRFVDRPWLSRHPGHPLFRYADDLLTMAESLEETQHLHATLARLTRSAGVPLKGSEANGLVDLATGRSIQWLGFSIRKDGDRVDLGIAQRAWDRLARELSKCHLHDAAPLRAAQVVGGWLGYLGPCYASEDHDQVIRRVLKVAAGYAFDELPRGQALHQVWSASHARWARLCEAARDEVGAQAEQHAVVS